MGHLLSGREVQILKLMALGLSNPVIAGELDIADRTVDTHISNIYTTLGVHNRTQAALWAVAHGLVALPPPPPWRATAAILVDDVA